MALVCTVCRSEAREAIEIALTVQNATLRDVARRFGLSKDAVARHKAAHIHPAVTQAAEKREDLRAEHILEQLRDLHQRTLVQLERAERDKAKPAEVARVVKECRENLATMGKLLGAFPAGAGTLIDNRTQILHLEGLTIDELRALANLGDADRRPSNGESNSGSVGVTGSLESPILEQTSEGQADPSRLGNGDGNDAAHCAAVTSVSGCVR
jgi:hypothetical protein